MTQGQAIRGVRIGATPSLHIERGEPVGHQRVDYWCANGHRTIRHFAPHANVPTEWDCRRCGWPAGIDALNPPARPVIKPFKTHLDYVRERRTEEEAEDILAEALAARAAARGERR
ncbi:RNA polymerase-binding protein RbpA [Haloglycomyces albus]|uniref:RNA polymerase-binding protein RbpA n=1 Tax=Haloglycomyces albus TaxID=526067 RepID=UPI00046D856A|nr:RNA polymerase-binding protein RbpA [Haloglycomyces albus]